MLKHWQRHLNYCIQNGHSKELTPKQQRRLDKKANYWSKRDQSLYVSD